MNLAKIRYFLRKVYLNTINSIAFYPVLFSALMLGLAWLCLFIDAISVGKELVEEVTFLSVGNPETARALLAALVGGLISLMVFSFSMVMVVLNQTASNYSPRILPGLVSQREHQIVLGIYMGTIGFTIAVFSNVESETFGTDVPGFSIVINLLLGFLCFIAFAYFIHEISTVIQIGNILKRLYNETRTALIRELASGNYSTEEFFLKNPSTLKAWQSGYFFSVAEKTLLKGAATKELQVRMLKSQGTYLLKGEPFLEINCSQGKEVVRLLQESFIFRHQEIIENNFYYGFKQITEVALKALSPGINDPGTALQAIDYLTDLLSMLLQLKGRRMITNKDMNPILAYPPVPFEETFYLCVSSIRNYAMQDVPVLVKLIGLIKKLQVKDADGVHEQLFEEELKAIEEMASKELVSSKDQEYILKWIHSSSEQNLK